MTPFENFQWDIVAPNVVLEQTTHEISDFRLTIPSIYLSWLSVREGGSDDPFIRLENF